jgi:hypothetical protein
MNKRVANALLCIALNLLVGCAGPVRVEPVSYQGWRDAYRLSNGTVDVVIAPGIGRIMRYGYIDGENLLWENPALAGRYTSTQPDKWGNFGGDKVLPWPQTDWTKRFGKDWPPPSDIDPLRYEVQVLPDNGLLLVSGLVRSFGFRVVREIHLAESGTLLTVTTRFEQIVPAEERYPVAVWSVTQWRGPDFILAQSAAAPLPLFGRFKPSERLAGDVIKIQRPFGEAAKLGLDTNVLAAAIGGNLVVQRADRLAGEHWQNGERAQVYCNGEGGEQSYVELEFTSPRQVLPVGASMELKVDWQTIPIHTAHETAEELAAKLTD